MIYTLELSSSEASAPKESSEDSSYSSHKNKSKKPFKNNSHGEIWMVQPPTFYGKVKSIQGDEA